MGKAKTTAGATPETAAAGPAGAADAAADSNGAFSGRANSAAGGVDGGDAAAAPRDPIGKPHDAICKITLDDPGRALSFILDHVPPLRGQVKSVKPASGAFTDSRTLRELQCDCVLEVILESGERKLVLVAVEHKSSPDAMSVLQLAKYLIAILERHVGGEAGKLENPPSIIPVLLYHGKDNWQLPERLDVTFGDGEDAPGFKMRCIPVNLSKMPESRLSSHPDVRSAFLTMRYVSGALQGGNRLNDVLNALPKSDIRFAGALVVYLLRVGPDSRARLESAITETRPDLRGVIMEQLGKGARELVAEGEAVGYGRGKADGLARLMQHRFNGDLTPEIRQQIAGASIEDLDRWLDRILEAPSLDAVFSTPPRH